MRQRNVGVWAMAAGAAIGAAMTAWTMHGIERSAHAADAPAPDAALAASVELGRHLVAIGSCHDCHTPGFEQGPAKVAEKDYMIGVPVGWRGPWGTSYASNVRLTVSLMPADQFIAMVRARSGLPPMPWASLHAMTDAELRGIYDYLKHLGPAGERTPAPVAPGVEPTTPYVSMEPITPKPVDAK